MKKLLISALLAFAICGSAHAQFVVSDPGSYVHEIQIWQEDIANHTISAAQLAQLAQQVLLMTTLLRYNHGLSGIMEATTMAAPMSSPAGCSTCSVWSQSSNTGSMSSDPTFGGVINALAPVVLQMAAMMDPSSRTLMDAEMASRIYLPRATLQNSVSTLGQVQANSAVVQQEIAACQANATSLSLVSPTEIGQTGNGCQTVNLQQQQANNALLEQQLQISSLKMAQSLNDETNSLNTDASLQIDAGATTAASLAGVSNAIDSFVMP